MESHECRVPTRYSTIRPMLTLPPIRDPERYEGLFAYDFGTHVSVGFTAGEILILRQSPEYCGGTALQIYRVNDRGGMELRGIQDSMLLGRDCICFLQSSEMKAREDYDRMVRAARERPLSSTVEARLVRSYVFSLPNLTALLFPAWAVDRVGAWLSLLDWSPGDRVISGTEALASMDPGKGLTIDTCSLAARDIVQDRDAEQVLASVSQAFQR